MRAVLHDFRRVLEAPLAHVEPLRLAASDEILGIERWIPRLDVQVSEHHVGDIRCRHGLVRRTVRRLGAHGAGHVTNGHGYMYLKARFAFS